MTTNEPETSDEQAMAALSDRSLRDHYCSLLQRALTRYEMESETSYIPIHAIGAHRALRPLIETGQKILRKRSLDFVRVWPPDAKMRYEGKDLPQSAETMVGMKRLNNLRECLVQIFADRVPGDILEAGVWRGGASIFMRGVL